MCDDLNEKNKEEEEEEEDERQNMLTLTCLFLLFLCSSGPLRLVLGRARALFLLSRSV